ncbi:hypothetical protein [Gordonia sp. CPCC 205333]|uniref:hypothetical protein n=1 Tax=Gordonia sp. CPCC 205333 TaxID=3140790 RepID=UPI003AF34A33
MSGQFRKVTKRVGIGTVVAICCVLLVVSVGLVLAIKTPPSTGYGQLRNYSSQPETAWTVDSDTLPEYGQGDGITVAGRWLDRWLLSYPSGLGRAYLLVSAVSGKPLWDNPIRVGLGSCALNDDGEVGCAVKLGEAANGFYLADLDSGKLGSVSNLDSTAQVVGVGSNFLRVDEAGYRAMLATPSGAEIWTRTFASAMRARFENRILILAGADGTNAVVDTATGGNRLRCTDCDINVYPSGITLQHNTYGKQSVDFYATSDGALDTSNPTHRSGNIEVVRGASTLPVLTGIGDATVQQTQGRYEIRDPAKPKALWAITDPELSKANTRPCGTVVALARKDRSRAIYRLADGTSVGNIPGPDLDNPDANIDQLTCVGSSEQTIVFANANQLTGFAVSDGTKWELPIIGWAQNVDGYLVLHQGQSLSVLAPD